MNPKPLASLNHFTVPVFLSLILVLAPCVAVAFHPPALVRADLSGFGVAHKKKRSDPLMRLSPALSDTRSAGAVDPSNEFPESVRILKCVGGACQAVGSGSV
jgi:hypothetical protein